jgi:hypothetical protein
MTLLFAAVAAFGTPDDEGFETLFDGRSAEGWRQAGPGGFTIHDGVATSHGGMGLWYYEKRKFKNYILKLEFRPHSPSTNSGVFIRFPRVENDPWIPVEEGYEIQIAGSKPGTHSTGSIYSFQAATDAPLRPAGEWNEYEITNIGPWIYVRLNGRLINTYKGDRSLKGGMVGVQNHDDKSLVDFRRIRVKELPDSATGYHVLYEGDARGWKQCGPGDFENKDGALTGRGGMGMLWYAERSFADFILLLDWKATKKTDNSGVFLRFPDPANDPWVAVHKGYEIQICDEGDPKHRTGAVYSFQESAELASKPYGEWNHYEIQAVGQQYTVRLNGRAVTEFKGDRSLEGFVGLQNHDDASRVAFRNVRVVPLAPPRKK